jgi:NAD(P)-dependent dehydrogenase (short-subunit alcohol dehydrogenase family)
MSAVAQRALDLTETSALITGGTSGVGLATAIMLATAGVPRIAVNGRNVERGEKARQAVLAKAPGADVIFVAGDCNELDQATAVCEAAKARFGNVDLLVNSTVGSYGPRLFHNIPIPDVPDMLVKQIMAPLLTCRTVWPWMQARSTGCIVNIASDAGKVATPGESVLGAAMAGIIMFSRTLAIEGKRNGIRVNVLTPSIIEGTITYGNVMNDEFSGKLFGKAVKMAQLGVVQPEDLAAMIVFLASPQAARFTGQAISINGGISAA